MGRELELAGKYCLACAPGSGGKEHADQDDDSSGSGDDGGEMRVVHPLLTTDTGTSPCRRVAKSQRPAVAPGTIQMAAAAARL